MYSVYYKVTVHLEQSALYIISRRYGLHSLPYALLTVKHIPLGCPDLQDIRQSQKYFSASSLKDIFESINNRNIIGFIKDAHFYHQL